IGSLISPGMSNVGHDCGGFAGPLPDAELFVRWVQNAIFHPRFCIHSWKADCGVNELWMYTNELPLLSEWVQFRYRLIPYLYSLFWQYHCFGTPVLRPLIAQYPHDLSLAETSFEFMLGPCFLVVPIYEPLMSARKVQLPLLPQSNVRWYGFYE